MSKPDLNGSIVASYQTSSSKRSRPVPLNKSKINPTEETIDKHEHAAPAEKIDREGFGQLKKKKGNKSNPAVFDSIMEDPMVNRNVEKQFLVERPRLRLANLAGINPILNQIKELIFFPILYPALYQRIGIRPPSGILLNGPSGCGKTSLANAIAGELDLPYFRVNGPELIGGMSGESEDRIYQLFQTAIQRAPSIIFIDSIDVIAGKADVGQRGMDKRVIAQLMDCIDQVSHQDNQDPINPDAIDESNISSNYKIVTLIAATNKPDHFEPSLRGRFSKEISLPIPDASSRTQILELMTSGMKIAEGIDFIELGKVTPGFVGSDLQALAREAGLSAVTRIVHQMEAKNGDEEMRLKKPIELKAIVNGEVIEDERSVQVKMEDFLLAAKRIQPAAKREGFATPPDVTWNDVGALAQVREELLHNILEPIAYPETFKLLGLEVPAGVLFFGPPGCGKTLLAKALANQSGANFISVKGPELLNKYVGESEMKVREVFARARASSPCVIFFDELDALCPKRGSGFDGGGGNGNGVSERVVNQLLTELDGLESRRDVYVIAATNRPELIDDAILRPGRLGKLLYVPLPTLEDRISILQAITRKISVAFKPVDNEVDVDKTSTDYVELKEIASDVRADGYSGADLAALVREAGLAVVREKIDQNILKNTTNYLELAELRIFGRHFEVAFGKVKPSVSNYDRSRFELVQSLIREGYGALEALRKASESY